MGIRYGTHANIKITEVQSSSLMRPTPIKMGQILKDSATSRYISITQFTQSKNAAIRIEYSIVKFSTCTCLHHLQGYKQKQVGLNFNGLQGSKKTLRLQEQRRIAQKKSDKSVGEPRRFIIKTVNTTRKPEQILDFCCSFVHKRSCKSLSIIHTYTILPRALKLQQTTQQ